MEELNNKIINSNNLIEKMNKINDIIKKNKYSTILGDQIYEICTELRIIGKELEKTNKDDLNNFFSSIRLATCRENGELGLPCRIKILELLEFRLMGWKTNLSNARYYTRKERELEEIKNYENEKSSSTSSIHSISPKYLTNKNEYNNELINLYSKQNFIPNNFSSSQQRPHYIDNSSSSSTFLSSQPKIFQFNIPPPPPSFPPPNCLLNTQIDLNKGINDQPGFIFIPSQTGTFISSPPSLPIFDPTGGNLNIFSSPPPPPSFHFSSIQPTFLNNNISSEYNLNELKQPKNKINTNLFREEINIRNSDSGKVMGVKGRRVALIEELSNTVISFQKVDPKCQNRQLTIIAEKQNAIECAKSLIFDTIERNTSPNRITVKKETNDKITYLTKDLDKKVELINNENKFQIIRQGDDSLKIAFDDPSILNLAQEAVNVCLKQISFKATNKNNKQKQIENNGKVVDATLSSKNAKYVYDKDSMLEIRKQLQNNPSFMEEASQRLINHELDICI